MKTEIALVLIVVAFVSGFLAGRRLPLHNYAAVSSEAKNIVLVDTVTGRVCSPIRKFVEQRVTESTLLSPDAADPVKLSDTLHKQSQNFDIQLGPSCPE
jgi:hypothetical protein